MRPWEDGQNPLLSDSPHGWSQLVDAVGPAALLVLIESRMSAALRRFISPEDIWQEALLHAWRDRRQHVWQGLRAFRGWLVAVSENRIRDAADRLAAGKRGGGRPSVSLDNRGLTGASTTDGWAGPIASTTPSRAAAAREEADAMRAALASLPPELGEVVRLRLFEQLPIEQIAEQLGIGPSAVRHRFRRGAELYRTALAALLVSRSKSVGAGAALQREKSSPAS